MNKEKIDLLVQKIHDAKSILIFGHKNPDGDSLGAALGLRHLIEDNFGKDADAAYDGNLPISLDFLPGRKDIWFAEKIKEQKYDLFIAVDMGSKIQLGEFGAPLLSAADFSVKFDHHKTVDWNADLEFVNDAASSACEIIYDIAVAAGWTISKDAATNLCTGIYTDTGHFAFIDAPNSRPLIITAELIKHGVNMREISEGLKNFTRGDVMAQAEILAHAEFFFNGKLAVAIVPHRLYKKLDSGATEIVKYLRQIKGVECLAILKEARFNEIGLSLRSRSMVIRHIAEKFGGGGHDVAAGAKITDANLDKAKAMLVKEFEGLF